MSKEMLDEHSMNEYESILFNETMLFELSAVPQMIVNEKRIILKINKKFSELFEYSESEIIGKNTSVLTPSQKKFEEYNKYFIKTKEGVFKSEELQYKRKDGTLIWTKLEGVPVHQKDDKLFILWSFINIDKEVKYREKLKVLASTDPLTGLFNRRFFVDISKSILELAKRKQRDISIIVLDLDRFKNINDTYGHIKGDDVLVNLSDILKEHTRKSDMVFRFGGEEFIILLPETPIKQASLVATKLKEVIEKHEIKLSNKASIKFTASFGVSSVNHAKDSSLEECIKRADEALYKAKNSGRNKVIVNYYS